MSILTKMTWSTCIALFFSGVLMAQSPSQSPKENKYSGVWVRLKPSFFQAKRNQNLMAEENLHPRDLNVKDHPWFLRNKKRTEVVEFYKLFHHEIEYQKLQRTYTIRLLNDDAVLSMMEDLKNDPDVELVEPIPVHKVTWTPNDGYYSYQWELRKINAAEGWDIARGSEDIVIAITDDAMDITHPDLKPSLWENEDEIPNNGIDDDGDGYVDNISGWDAPDNDNNPMIPNGQFTHGTHVSGTCGAATNNGTGVAAVAGGVKILPIRCGATVGAISHGVEGVLAAAKMGADVINMSWGSDHGGFDTEQEAMKYAYDKGAVLVAAAGNSATNADNFYPCAYPHVISVAATSNNDSKAGFSNYGTTVDISAPGTGIYSCVPGASYQTMDGTSMASPLVASVCGLLLSHVPAMSPDEVEECLKQGADNIDGVNSWYAGKMGAGRVNVPASLRYAAQNFSNSVKSRFNSDQWRILAGTNVQFSDDSYGEVTSWKWEFEGGTPSTSTSANPTVTYNQGGKFEVKLTVKNASNEDVLIKDKFIHVFEGEIPPAWCAGTHSMEYATITRAQVGGETQSIDHSSNDWNPNNDFTDKLSEVALGRSYDLTLNINMGYPGSRIGAWVDWNYDGTFDDANENIMDIQWTSLNATEDEPYVVNHTFTVPQNALKKKTLIRFRVFYIDNDGYNGPFEPCGSQGPGESEDYYLDVMDPATIGFKPVVKKLDVYPNPANDRLFIDNDHAGEVENIVIRDISGKLIRSFPGNLNSVPVEDLLPGLYFIQLQSENGIWQSRFAKQ